MGEHSKEEVLSELYAIRATLSLVSKNQSAVDECDMQIKTSKQNNQKSVQKIEDANREKEARLLALTNKSRIGVLTKSLAEVEEKKKEKEKAVLCNSSNIRAQKSFLREKFGEKICVPFIALGIFLAICWIGGSFLGYKLEKAGILIESKLDTYKIFIWFVAPAILTIVFTLIFRAIITAPNSQDRADFAEWESKIQKDQAEIVKLEQKSLKIKNEIQALQAAINRGEVYANWLSAEALNTEQKELEEREEIAQKAELQQIDAKTQEIYSIAERSQEIIENARKLYSVIDFRDWENVDLIIFYYETGRAETMKEALQQVDRQRQNETLVKAIGMATEIMAKTIRDSIGSLQNSLENSFRKLSVQLEFQHQRSMEEVSDLGAKINAQNEQLRNLGEKAEDLRFTAEAQANIHAKNQEMTNALLEKINVSSTQLAYDMDKQMKLVHHIEV